MDNSLSEDSFCRVTIQRVSNNGNLLAITKKDGAQVLLSHGQPGEETVVFVGDDESGESLEANFCINTRCSSISEAMNNFSRGDELELRVNDWVVIKRPRYADDIRIAHFGQPIVDAPKTNYNVSYFVLERSVPSKHAKIHSLALKIVDLLENVGENDDLVAKAEPR